MKLEQALAAATPANECKIDSFENYADALDHCKESRSVGFFLVSENVGELPLADVFEQLARPYEAKGFPAFGALLHEAGESFIGHRLLQKSSRVIDYLPSSSLLERSNTGETIDRLWNRFIDSFESSIIPLPLQQTLVSIARARLDDASRNFRDRVSQLLSANLNVSWLDSVALRWAPVVTAVQAMAPDALKPHSMLTQICAQLDASASTKNIEESIASKAPLASRVSRVCELLDQARMTGSLESELLRIGTQSKPGASALLRHLAAKRERIVRLAGELATSEWASEVS
jgi:hypothetical protein